MLLQITFIVLIAGALILLLANYGPVRGIFGRFGSKTEPEVGNLHITGVSPPPSAQGEQYVTVTGILSGPSVPGETVYRRFAWDVGQWPTPGENMPVIYPPGKPQHWAPGQPPGRM